MSASAIWLVFIKPESILKYNKKESKQIQVDQNNDRLTNRHWWTAEVLNKIWIPLVETHDGFKTL